MPTVEQIGLFIAGVVAIAALLTAVGVIFRGLKNLWSFLVRFVKTVDVIAEIPERLDKIDAGGLRRDDRLDNIEQALEAHIVAAASAARDYNERILPLIKQMAEDIEVTKQISVETHHEVRNNGGSSLKDSAHRIETALGLADPKRTEGNNERDLSPEAPSAP